MRFFSFSKTCLLCQFQAALHDDLCEACWRDLRETYHDARHVCPQCATFSANGETCDKCRGYPPPYDKLWACARYVAPFPTLLHEWKHQQRAELATIFRAIVCDNPPPWLTHSGIDAILAMPVSRERRLQRGFNQCDELADVLATRYQMLRLPYDAVFRQNKPPQSTLHAVERVHNIRDVFRVDFDVKKRKLLIIDDITTTSATISELSRVLLASGAAAVFVCVVARN